MSNFAKRNANGHREQARNEQFREAKCELSTARKRVMSNFAKRNANGHREALITGGDIDGTNKG